MAITPFTPGKVSTSEDYDKAYDKLQKWLDKTTDLYLESPEYKALSKANKKSQGDWFAFFMEMNLRYVSGKLKDVDVGAAQEIMEDLIPRKMICSDTQAKTIVPDLIAYWSFLLRECGDKKLPYAASVISYLKSIKKDYLQIYKGQDESSLVPLGMSNPENPNFIDWVEWLINQLIENNPTTNILETTEEEWSDMLASPHAALQVVQHLCLNPDDTTYNERTAAKQFILSLAFQYLFMAVRSQNQEALEILNILESNIIRADEAGLLLQENTKLVFQALTPHRAYISSNFLDFIQQWHMDEAPENFDRSDATPPSNSDIQRMIFELLEETTDEFEAASVMQQSLGMMPAQGLAAVFHTLAATHDTRMGNLLTLYVLDVSSDVGAAAIQAMMDHPACVSPISLNRLIRIRNWLKGSLQKKLDKLIKTLRKQGIAPAAPEGEYDIQEIWMPPLDGSGGQGFMALLRKGHDYRMAGCVLKESAGIVDSFVSPFGMKKHMLEIVRSARSELGKMEKVSPELLHALLPAFLHTHKQSTLPYEHELIQILEILGLESWNPETKDLLALLPPETLLKADEEEIANVQRLSNRWTATTLCGNWYMEDEPVAKIIEREHTKHDPNTALNTSITATCDELLEDQRQLWQNRLVRMALWAHHGKNKRLKRHVREFLVVHQLIESGMRMQDIVLMRDIARKTVQHIVYSPLAERLY